MRQSSFGCTVASRTASSSSNSGGTPSVIQLSDMLIFCARHRIVADYEVMPMSQLDAAVEKLDSGNMEKLRICLVREDKMAAFMHESNASDTDATIASRRGGS